MRLSVTEIKARTTLLLAPLAVLALGSCSGSGSRGAVAGIAKPSSTSNPLVSWSFSPTSLFPAVTEFGNVVYDPEAGLWRMFYGRLSDIRSVTGDSPTRFSNDETVALIPEPSGAWDDYGLDVPYVWYEAGQNRPWRMLFRGSNGIGGDVGTRDQIGLATAPPEKNGRIEWQRADTNGKPLAGPVVPESTSGWVKNQEIDFGSLIKISGVYYLYYSSISTPRMIGLATSTDLVSWKPDPANPLFKGVVNSDSPNQGPDADYPGVPARLQGFFCPDIVYWPTASGVPRYVLIAVHYSSFEHPSYDVYTCDSPEFLESRRHYVGKIIETKNTNYTVDGSPLGVSGIDTPRIITDDISRNVVTSTRAGNGVTLVACVETQDFSWRMVEFFSSKF